MRQKSTVTFFFYLSLHPSFFNHKISKSHITIFSNTEQKDAYTLRVAFCSGPKRMVILGYAKGSTSNGHIRKAALGRAQRSTSNGHIP